MVTLEEVLKTHEELCANARSVIETKGHDYNREQQKGGDTLFNLTVAKLLGVTDTTTQSILVRLGDKYMRLVSLTKDPNTEVSVKDESVRDTVEDTINYVIYLYLKYLEEKKERDGKLNDAIYKLERLGVFEEPKTTNKQGVGEEPAH